MQDRIQAISMYYNPVRDEFHWQRTGAGDIYFSSLLEKAVYISLKKIIAVSNIKFQPTFILAESKQPGENITWTPDFLIGNKLIVEAKGYITDDFQLKARLFRIVYPETKLLICGNEQHLKKYLHGSLHQYVVDLEVLNETVLTILPEVIKNELQNRRNTSNTTKS